MTANTMQLSLESARFVEAQPSHIPKPENESQEYFHFLAEGHS